jgi:AbrB family looped-hinge helix DNA binding protein
MHATVTDKGQVTVPKDIRDRLGIEAGTKLDFRIEDDGTLRVRKLDRGSAGLFGLLHDAAHPPVAVAEMDVSVGRYLVGDDERIRATATGKARRR